MKSKLCLKNLRKYSYKETYKKEYNEVIMYLRQEETHL